MTETFSESLLSAVRGSSLGECAARDQGQFRVIEMVLVIGSRLGNEECRDNRDHGAGGEEEESVDVARFGRRTDGKHS